MVAGCELWDTSEVDAEWEVWEAECEAAWELKAQELVALGYVKVPDRYFGAVFEREGKRYSLVRKLASTVWEVEGVAGSEEGLG